MKNSRSSKTKAYNGELLLMKNNLFSKLSSLEEPTNKQMDELGFQLATNAPDSLTQLMCKAKYLTSNNQQLIKKAKKQIKQSKKDKTGTFLTGCGVYTEEINQPRHYETINSYQQLDHEAMLKQITQKGQFDDLAELRRMIKQTGQNLDDYGKQVYRTRNEVLGAANRFNSSMSSSLAYQLHSMKIDKKPKNNKQTACGVGNKQRQSSNNNNFVSTDSKKRFSSSTNIRGNRYMPN